MMRHQESLCRPCKHSENDAGIALHLPDDRDIQVPEEETTCDASELARIRLTERGGTWEARADWGGWDALFGGLPICIMCSLVVAGLYQIVQILQPPFLGTGPMPLTLCVAAIVVVAGILLWMCFSGSTCVTIENGRLEVVNDWRLWRTTRSGRVEDVRYARLAWCSIKPRLRQFYYHEWRVPCVEVWVDCEYPIYLSGFISRPTKRAIFKMLRGRLGVPSKRPIETTEEQKGD